MVIEINMHDVSILAAMCRCHNVILVENTSRTCKTVLILSELSFGQEIQTYHPRPGIRLTWFSLLIFTLSESGKTISGSVRTADKYFENIP